MPRSSTVPCRRYAVSYLGTIPFPVVEHIYFIFSYLNAILFSSPFLSHPTTKPRTNTAPLLSNPSLLPTMKISLQLISFLLIVAVVRAQLTGDLNRKVVQSFGSATDTFSAHLKLQPSERLVSAHLSGIDRRIATNVQINTVRTAVGTNVTTSVTTDGELGFTTFRLIAKTNTGNKYTLDGTLDVIGVRFNSKGSYLKNVGRSAAVTAQVYAGKDKPVVRLANCAISVSGRNSFMDKNDLTIAGNTLLLRPLVRKGTRTATVNVDCPTVHLDGETAENALYVEPTASLSSQSGDMRL